MERVTGIGPAYPAWKAGVLPLNYTRVSCAAWAFSLAILSYNFLFVKCLFCILSDKLLLVRLAAKPPCLPLRGRWQPERADGGSVLSHIPHSPRPKSVPKRRFLPAPSERGPWVRCIFATKNNNLSAHFFKFVQNGGKIFRQRRKYHHGSAVPGMGKAQGTGVEHLAVLAQLRLFVTVDDVA